MNPEILEGLLGLGNYNFVKNHFLSKKLKVFTQLAFLFCTVGGVMAFLTLYEMLPLAFEYAGRKDAVKAVFVGMAFMSMRFVMLLAYGISIHRYLKLHIVG